MNRFIKAITAASALAGMVAASSVVEAQEFTLRVDPGMAVPLTPPQSNKFFVGGAAEVKGFVGITPYVDLGVGVGGIVLPGLHSGHEDGSALLVGGGARVKRPHDFVNNPHKHIVRSASPWIDAEVQYVRTGPLDRLGWNVGTGVAFALTDEREVWGGPFIKYQNIYSDAKVGMDTRDAKMLIIGINLEFGGEQARPKAPVVKKVVSDRDRDGVPDSKDRCPDVPGPIANHGCPYPVTPKAGQIEIRVVLQQTIQFAWDSAVLNQDAKTKLDRAANLLLHHKYENARVEGHASSEGQVEHNKVLAGKRAQAVADYLVGKGVSRQTLATEGFGIAVPVATNATEAGRVKNRRAEFSVSFILSGKAE